MKHRSALIRNDVSRETLNVDFAGRYFAKMPNDTFGGALRIGRRRKEVFAASLIVFVKIFFDTRCISRARVI